MYYRSGHDHLEYQPDFVAETSDCILMLEPKMATQMQDKDVLRSEMLQSSGAPGQ
ncbi:MAG: hypothetical protein IPL18_14380 [Sphingomonadales bacterium]|nr:hypothetical protein [Sphingomonadales bacterium]